MLTVKEQVTTYIRSHLSTFKFIAEIKGGMATLLEMVNGKKQSLFLTSPLQINQSALLWGTAVEFVSS
jgi:hypothetical protein